MSNQQLDPNLPAKLASAPSADSPEDDFLHPDMELGQLELADGARLFYAILYNKSADDLNRYEARLYVRVGGKIHRSGVTDIGC